MSWNDVRTAEAGLYQVSLKDINGREIWSQATDQAISTVPNSAGLRAGSVYLWQVDVMMPDGIVLTTGPRTLGFPE